jgi:hypothetical protein
MNSDRNALDEHEELPKPQNSIKTIPTNKVRPSAIASRFGEEEKKKGDHSYSLEDSKEEKIWTESKSLEKNALSSAHSEESKEKFTIKMPDAKNTDNSSVIKNMPPCLKSEENNYEIQLSAPNQKESKIDLDMKRLGIPKEAVTVDLSKLKYGSTMQVGVAEEYRVVSYEKISYFDKYGELQSRSKSSTFCREGFKKVDAIILPSTQQLHNFVRETVIMDYNFIEWFHSEYQAHFEIKAAFEGFLGPDSVFEIENLILDKFIYNEEFLKWILFYYRNKWVDEFTLYEIKDGKLVKPIDSYQLKKPFDYNRKFDFVIRRGIFHHSDIRVNFICIKNFDNEEMEYITQTAFFILCVYEEMGVHIFEEIDFDNKYGPEWYFEFLNSLLLILSKYDLVASYITPNQLIKIFSFVFSDRSLREAPKVYNKHKVFEDYFKSYIEMNDYNLKDQQHKFWDFILSIITGSQNILKLKYKKDEDSLVSNWIGRQLSYAYMQILENFNGDLSDGLMENKRQFELDVGLAVKMYQVYWELNENTKSEKEFNILQQSSTDSLFFPTYLAFSANLYKMVKSCCRKERSYLLENEGLKEKLDDKETRIKALNYFNRYTSHIEILNHKGKIEKKYFMIPPVFLGLTQDKKDKLWMSFKKENAEAVCLSIWKDCFKILNTFHSLYIVSKMKIFGFLSKNEDKMWRLVEHLILFINLLVLISQGYAKNSDPKLGSLSYGTTIAIIFIFGTCVLLISLTLIITKLVIAVITKQSLKENKEELTSWKRFCWKFSQYLQIVGTTVVKQWALILNIIFAVLGYVDTILYWGCLIFSIKNQKSMMNVLKAIWMAKYLLIATILLILIWIYFFAVFSVLALEDDFEKNLEGSCENVWYCSITVFDSWYKADGTIGGWLGDASPSISLNGEYNTDAVRILSDFTFNLIVGILLIEIFSGILTDTFAKIRSEQENLSEIQESRCFICDKESKDIFNFKEHTKYQHNLWDYIIYIYTLVHSQSTSNNPNGPHSSKYQEIKTRSGAYFEQVTPPSGAQKYKTEVKVEGVKYLECVISGKIPVRDSDEYIIALLAHYEMTKDGGSESKPFDFETYLSWLPFNATSKDYKTIEVNLKKEINKKFDETNDKIIKIENEMEIMKSEIKEDMRKIDRKLEDILNRFK